MWVKLRANIVVSLVRKEYPLYFVDPWSQDSRSCTWNPSSGTDTHEHKHFTSTKGQCVLLPNSFLAWLLGQSSGQATNKSVNQASAICSFTHSLTHCLIQIPSPLVQSLTDSPTHKSESRQLLGRSFIHSLWQHITHQSLAQTNTYWLKQPVNHPITQPFNHSGNHSITHLLRQPLAHSFIHSLTQTTTHSLSQTPTHSVTQSPT